MDQCVPIGCRKRNDRTLEDKSQAAEKKKIYAETVDRLSEEREEKEKNDECNVSKFNSSAT